MVETITGERLAEEIAEYWDERAESYSNGVRGELGDNRHVAWLRVLEGALCGHITEAFFNGTEVRVLDLGCGPGFFSILFAELGCRVDAIDASDEMVARATSNARRQSCADRVTFHVGDVVDLPFEDGTFDIVACRNVTWLMREPEAAYREWLRVLRPGGKLVVFDANWYLYLVDPMIDAQRRSDQEGREVVEWAEDARATTAEERRCEIIAAELPLTPIVRPAWDLEVLEKLGASHVSADESVWAELWTRSEQEFYASSPLFMVEALKAP